MPALCADILSPQCLLIWEHSLGLWDACESLYEEVFLFAEIAERLARGELTFWNQSGSARGLLGCSSSVRLSLIYVLKNIHLIVCRDGKGAKTRELASVVKLVENECI